MHIAAMKPAYLLEEDIPEEVKQQVLESENGQKAFKKFVKRDVLFKQELATAEKSETVERFIQSQSRQLKSNVGIKNWALFMIE
mmetsp:Transcript_12945/g.21903  ORF Transcript_12945/g.21903 Transcript_12945/m.21903 type:complete len:84 (+) Transcript_12945:739-990(+)